MTRSEDTPESSNERPTYLGGLLGGPDETPLEGSLDSPSPSGKGGRSRKTSKPSSSGEAPKSARRKQLVGVVLTLLGVCIVIPTVYELIRGGGPDDLLGLCLRLIPGPALVLAGLSVMERGRIDSSLEIPTPDLGDPTFSDLPPEQPLSVPAAPATEAAGSPWATATVWNQTTQGPIGATPMAPMTAAPAPVAASTGPIVSIPEAPKPALVPTPVTAAPSIGWAAPGGGSALPPPPPSTRLDAPATIGTAVSPSEMSIDVPHNVAPAWGFEEAPLLGDEAPGNPVESLQAPAVDVPVPAVDVPAPVATAEAEAPADLVPDAEVAWSSTSAVVSSTSSAVIERYRTWVLGQTVGNVSFEPLEVDDALDQWFLLSACGVATLLAWTHEDHGATYPKETWIDEVLPGQGISIADRELALELLVAAALHAGGVHSVPSPTLMRYDATQLVTSMASLHVGLLRLYCALEKASPVKVLRDQFGGVDAGGSISSGSRSNS